MSYTELIDDVLEKLELNAEDIAILRIDFPKREITIITNTTQKVVFPMPEPEEEAPQTKRTKMIKRVK